MKNVKSATKTSLFEEINGFLSLFIQCTLSPNNIRVCMCSTEKTYIKKL